MKYNIDVNKILESREEDMKTILQYAEDVGKSGPSTSQLRNLYEPIKKLSSSQRPRKDVAKIILMLEYANKRNALNSKEFYLNMKKLLDQLLERAEDEKKRQNFTDFMEAVIAYSPKK